MTDLICNIWKVEHGSSAFIQTPNKKIILVDAGSSEDFSPSEYLYKNWKVRDIELLVISHPHDDHISDLPNIIEKFNIKLLLRNKNIPDDLVYQNGTKNLKEPLNSYYNISNQYNNDYNKIFDFSSVDIKWYLLNKNNLDIGNTNINNYSLVFTVSYNKLYLIFPGDLEPVGWDSILDHTNIINDIPISADCKILVAPHHGRRSGVRKSDGSVYTRFLNELKPNLVIISDKWGNETTDPEAYRPYCLGYQVQKIEDGKIIEIEKNKRIITTKRNNCISIQASHYGTEVKIFN